MAPLLFCGRVVVLEKWHLQDSGSAIASTLTNAEEFVNGVAGSTATRTSFCFLQSILMDMVRHIRLLPAIPQVYFLDHKDPVYRSSLLVGDTYKMDLNRLRYRIKDCAD